MKLADFRGTFRSLRTAVVGLFSGASGAISFLLIQFPLLASTMSSQDACTVSPMSPIHIKSFRLLQSPKKLSSSRMMWFSSQMWSRKLAGGWLVVVVVVRMMLSWMRLLLVGWQVEGVEAAAAALDEGWMSGGRGRVTGGSSVSMLLLDSLLSHHTADHRQPSYSSSYSSYTPSNSFSSPPPFSFSSISSSSSLQHTRLHPWDSSSLCYPPSPPPVIQNSSSPTPHLPLPLLTPPPAAASWFQVHTTQSFRGFVNRVRTG